MADVTASSIASQNVMYDQISNQLKGQKDLTQPTNVMDGIVDTRTQLPVDEGFMASGMEGDRVTQRSGQKLTRVGEGNIWAAQTGRAFAFEQDSQGGSSFHEVETVSGDNLIDFNIDLEAAPEGTQILDTNETNTFTKQGDSWLRQDGGVFIYSGITDSMIRTDTIN